MDDNDLDVIRSARDALNYAIAVMQRRLVDLEHQRTGAAIMERHDLQRTIAILLAFEQVQ